MRQKRAKTYRKLMAQYERAFGFRQPYQVLVNSDFCEMAIQLKMEFMKDLEIVLQAKAKPMITQCCIAALYALGPTGQSIVDLAKTFERRRCGHLETPLSPEECIASVVGPTNRHRYVVMTQSDGLRPQMREVEGVPIVALNRAVMVLEMMSEKTKLKIRAEEVKALRPVLKAARGEKPPPAPVVRKKKPKAPNPLSVKRKVPRAVEHHRPEGEQAVRLGKRGREEEEVQKEETGEVQQERKKRKRRKKNKSAAAVEDVAGADEEED
ncbi:hypothetical protein DACRYDRAFT_97107 [Dacryopinax primogenitus]|uniref:U three protein 23 n=1 Tax=Dacryopinax primogenitus (strain DJM 731) TaxID=1858805 RepID=M5G1U7_DACPD|nr:uncharacterized protein DACRYDRAFT_97107 [Dacryopinax primogenitus]EJT97712.1 hypothetical protein DACRYDRAFT_97107 [Dacryopinax primogenitus]